MKTQLTGKRILFAAVPTDGHFNPLTGLAKYLQDAGCDVRWYVSAIFKDKLEKLDMPLYPYVKALDINVQNMHLLIPGLETKDPVKKTKLYLEYMFTGRATEYYEDIRDIYQSFPFHLMICDSLFTAIPFVKYHLNIPVLSIGVIPLPEFSVDVAPYKSGLPPAEDEETRAKYAELYQEMLAVYEQPITAFSKALAQYGISFEGSDTFYSNVLVKASDFYLQIGTPGIEYQRSDISNHVHFIGALMPYTTRDTSKAPWFNERLNRYKKVVLVTQGTVENDITKLLVPTLEAFKGTDVLVIATTGGNGTATLKKQYLADNVIIEDFLPFEEVMRHASVYVTNGGYGGAILSLKNKLPMVTAGLNEGKIEICARIDYFKYGIDLKTETPNAQAIYNAATTIMENEVYKDNVIRISREFDIYPSYELCTDYVIELLEKYKQVE